MTDTATTDDGTQAQFELLDATPKVPKVARATAFEKKRIRGLSDVATLAPWESLVMADDNIRDAGRANIKALAENIRLVGLIQPISVEPYPTRKGGKARWLVAAGHRRYLALKALGFTKGDLVPVHPLEVHTQGFERTTRMLAENVHREDLGPIDEAEMIEKLSTLYSMSQADIADHLGWNKGTVNQRLALLELPATVQRQVTRGEIGIELGQRIGKLIKAGATDKTMQKIYRAAHQAWGEGEVRAAERKLKAAKAGEALKARLEARGVNVVLKPGRAPAKKGHIAAQSALVGELATAAAVKDLDLDKMETIRDPDTGDPWLFVDTRYDGEAIAWALKTMPKPKPEPSNARYDYQAERVVKQALRNKRLAWFADVERPNDKDLLQLTVSALMSGADVDAIAKMVGLPTDADDEGATVAGWLDGASTAKLKAIMWAAVVDDAADRIRDGSSLSRLPGRDVWHREACFAAGMPPGVGEKAFDALTKAAREKMDAQAAADKSSDE